MVDDRTNRSSTDSVYQPSLFETSGRMRLIGNVGQINDLAPDSSLDIARFWYRRYLEQSGYPRNTVDSYSYDLSILNSLIGPKRINQITSKDIAQYLDASLNRSTRKRRLTSASSFFRFLIVQAQVLDRDPAQSFHPDAIPLKTPRPLFLREQQHILEAAEEDGPRAHAIVWMLLRLGLTRAELLRLRHQDIDHDEQDGPVIYIYYDHPRYAAKERKIAAGREFEGIYQRLADQYGHQGELFKMLPQSVNRLIERVATAAGIERPVSPQLLRDTFAVNQARNGLDEQQLLELLGLANDPRNRTSVQRYIKLARPPLQPGEAPPEDDSPSPAEHETGSA
jgi:integrase/recombinase XerD